MSKPLALVVDDEPDIRELVSLTLERMGVDSRAAANLAEARELLEGREFTVCLTDMQLPDGDGIDLVEHMRERYPDVPVAVITAHGSIDTAIRALKAGAFDFVSKPVDLAVLRKLINSALALNLNPVEDRRSRTQLLGDSEPMQRIRSMIAKLSRSQAPVYISGESGTGKELVARLIHEKGPRREKPFVPVNCGAIPTELMESEFFGHKKGAFTGASADKHGLFQAADGGTLFLDEVAELPLHMQVKLLRAIQERAVRPVGAHSEIPVDVRILSATHKSLGELVEQGEFRQDLYYRINVIKLRVPPLRERRGDIPALVELVLDRLYAGTPRSDRPQLSPEALDALARYAFPGNVRELENIIERAITFCEGRLIGPRDLALPDGADGPAEPPLAAADVPAITDGEFALDDYLDDVEREMLRKALEQTRYNKTAAAKLLGISFRTMRYKLKKLGID